MKRMALLLSLLSGAGTAHALSWADLWLTQDQQAQHLLDSGKAADAAPKFEDPRRRAYAEIEAGKYAEAAQLLERFPDPQSQYNRGNALARAGRLENALAAYDETIKQTTAKSTLGQDARRNRELVAEQLKKQQQSSQSSANDQSQADKQSSGSKQSANQDQGQSGNQSQPGQQNQPSSGQQGQSGADNKNEQRDSDQQQSGNGSDKQQSQGSQGSQNQQSSPGEAPKPGDSRRDASGTEKRQQDAQAQRNATSGTEGQKQDARAQHNGTEGEKQDAQPQPNATSGTEAQRQDARARNDGASGSQSQELNAARDQRAAGATPQTESRIDHGTNEAIAQAEPSTDRTGTSDAATQESQPSERTLALDQWLRQIPDDPAGLLRRKFLIEHLRRQGSQEELQ